ncbi:YdbL family protein [Dokdonella sp.]|uniref:YdbL family protein n=1 Tax=Dokdonella sp. TaxID=2291710 RepID=UPI0026069078|nr:YdbL family protein [Dokdonella sp.]
MKKLLIGLVATTAFALLAACVTINVYFPEAAADKAAQQFVDKVLEAAPKGPPPSNDPPPPGKSPGAMLLDFLVPSAYAQSADISIQTPQIQAIQSRMQQRFASSLSSYFANGAIGFTADGLVAMRDAAAVPLPQRAALNTAIADENRDRQAVYREIAVANGHAEWESQIRGTFAKQWVQQAKAGWYYQDASGAWKQK